MRLLCLLLLAVVLTGAAKKKLVISKCCETFQMLSSDGRSCVDAPWPRKHTFREYWSGKTHIIVLRPDDAPWVSRWLAPGVPLDRVEKVDVGWLRVLSVRSLLREVETSAEWDERQAEAEGVTYWRNRVVFTDGGILRRETRNLNKISTYGEIGHLIGLFYCVDATQNPRAPFALILDRNVDIDEYVKKCCPAHRVMAAEGGGWTCKDDAQFRWSPAKSSFTRFLPPELPFYSSYGTKCYSVPTRALRLTPGDERMAYLLRRRVHQFLFSTWDTCVDFERRKDGTVGETVFYCRYSRIMRGVYWLLRPLSFVAVALLLVSLLSIACNSSMRRKAHGRCLACHGVCLLAYNVGQLAYYMTVSDEIDIFNYVPPHLVNMCQNLAWPLYFLLTAANSWLTALCFNMAWGFRKLQVARPGRRGDRRRFLALSAFAWGLPAFMTGISAYAFEKNHLYRKWYSPSLSETRTCYNEMAASQRISNDCFIV